MIDGYECYLKYGMPYDIKADILPMLKHRGF